MKTTEYNPNTVLPSGGELIKPFTIECGTWVPQKVDAKVKRLGLTWYRIKSGMGGDGQREDWIADIPGVCVSVHDYHWNGEDFGPNHGSFDNAVVEQIKWSLGCAESRLKEERSKLAQLEAGIVALKKALGK